MNLSAFEEFVLGLCHDIGELMYRNEREVVERFDEFANRNFEGLFEKHPNAGPVVASLANKWKAPSPEQLNEPEDLKQENDRLNSRVEELESRERALESRVQELEASERSLRDQVSRNSSSSSDTSLRSENRSLQARVQAFETERANSVNARTFRNVNIIKKNMVFPHETLD